MIRDEIRTRLLLKEKEISKAVGKSLLEYNPKTMTQGDRSWIKDKGIAKAQLDKAFNDPQLKQCLELLEKKGELEKRDKKQYQFAIVDRKAKMPNYITWDFEDRKKVTKIHQDILKAGFNAKIIEVME